MAGQEDSAAAATTAPRAEGSGQEQEKPQAQDEAGRQQTEAATSGGEGTTGSQQQQQTEKEPPSPPLPPRPLPPPPHQGSRNSRPPLPMPMPQQGVHFGPLPIEVDDDKPDAPYERRSSPRWQKASLIIGGMSLVTSAIILGVGIGLGYLSAPYYRYWDLFTLADLQFVLSASAVCFDAPQYSSPTRLTRTTGWPGDTHHRPRLLDGLSLQPAPGHAPRCARRLPPHHLAAGPRCRHFHRALHGVQHVRRVRLLIWQ